ncbi:MAG: hypothetical protein L6V93_10800 [Clostridiales bacterium]|nr:MAG: hypothetical protein L6V93_10800 [Clostridiales bacterium]
MTKSAQVICITHLAQIAALADKHFLIEKKPKTGARAPKSHRLTEICA